MLHQREPNTPTHDQTKTVSQDSNSSNLPGVAFEGVKEVELFFFRNDTEAEVKINKQDVE